MPKNRERRRTKIIITTTTILLHGVASKEGAAAYAGRLAQRRQQRQQSGASFDLGQPFIGNDGMNHKLTPNETLQETIERLSLIRGMKDTGRGHIDLCLSSSHAKFPGDWHHVTAAVANALRAHGRSILDGQVYEFGVYDGKSMLSLWRTLRPEYEMPGLRNNKSDVFMWGLDSFQGLPADIDEGEERVWSKGWYSSPKGVQNNVENAVEAPVGWVAGWYNEVLTDDLPKERNMKPALYIGVDVVR